jgi:succinyl-CoA synthetase beta subunit
MYKVDEFPKEQNKILKTFSDGYIIQHCLTYDVLNMKNAEVYICLVLDVSIDEYYWSMDIESRVNIDKFKESLTEALSEYIRRYLI